MARSLQGLPEKRITAADSALIAKVSNAVLAVGVITINPPRLFAIVRLTSPKADFLNRVNRRLSARKTTEDWKMRRGDP